jgi:hypothetical protein
MVISFLKEMKVLKWRLMGLTKLQIKEKQIKGDLDYAIEKKNCFNESFFFRYKIFVVS